MGMILAGITEGIGAGIASGAKQDNSLDLLRYKMEALKEMKDAANASKETIAAGRGAAGGRSAAGGDPDQLSEGMTNRQAAFDLGVGGDTIAAANTYADSGVAPMVQSTTNTLNEPSAAQADPSSVGDGGEDYSDATSRRMQQDQSTVESKTTQSADQGFLSWYSKNSKNIGRSNRASLQPKDVDKIAKASGDYQEQGLVGTVASGGNGSNNAATALLASKGKGAYDAAGVNTVTGDLNALGKATMSEKLAQSSHLLAQTSDVLSGKVKPKDMALYIESLRKDVTSQAADLNKQEAAANSVLKDPLASPDQKATAKADLVGLKTARANLTTSRSHLVDMQNTVGGSLGLVGGANPSAVPGRSPDLTAPAGPGRAAMPATLDTTAGRQQAQIATLQGERDTLAATPGAKQSDLDALDREIIRAGGKPTAAAPAGAAPAPMQSKDVLRAEAQRQREKTASDLAAFKPPAQKAAPAGTVAIGDVVNGYTFKGGDINDGKSWERAAVPKSAPQAEAKPDPAPRSGDTVANGIQDGHMAEVQQLVDGVKQARKAIAQAAASGNQQALNIYTQHAKDAYSKLEKAANQYFPQRADKILDLTNG